MFRVSDARNSALKFTVDANNTWTLDHISSDEYNLRWTNQHGGTTTWQRIA